MTISIDEHRANRLLVRKVAAYEMRMDHLATRLDELAAWFNGEYPADTLRFFATRLRDRLDLECKS